jgi:hypothetical protein
MTKTYFTIVCGDEIALTADFAQAACPIQCDYLCGRQVADFRHWPNLAMRAAVEEYLSMGGDSLNKRARAKVIADAVEAMKARPVTYPAPR